MSTPVVGVVMASKADQTVMEQAARQLEELDVAHEIVVVSPLRSPEAAVAWARTARERGLQVLLAGDAGAAHLPGFLAAHTDLPVIAVPCATSHLGGADSLYGATQLPDGVAVTSVGLDRARNAALAAVRILALHDDALRDRLARVRASDEEDGVDSRTWTGTATSPGFGFRP